MLEVQEFLNSGKSFDDLSNELAINVTKHESLPLCILNYSMIDSPKHHPNCKECRGLILHTDNYS